MPVGQWILLHVPTVIIAFSMLLISAGIAVGGLLIVRRFVPPNTLKSHHDIAGPIFATIGVIYAVLLAFVTIIVWQDFNDANRNLVMEANYYGDIYRNAIGFPEPFRGEFRAAMKTYVDTVISEEWHSLAYGYAGNKVPDAAQKVNGLFASYEPATDKEKIFYQQTLNKMDQAGEARLQRLLDGKEGLPPILWMVLILGGMITIVFTFFFGSDNKIAQMIMTMLLAVLIALVLFTIFVMDFPFTGDLKVSTEALEQMLIQGRN